MSAVLAHAADPLEQRRRQTRLVDRSIEPPTERLPDGRTRQLLCPPRAPAFEGSAVNVERTSDLADATWSRTVDEDGSERDEEADVDAAVEETQRRGRSALAAVALGTAEARARVHEPRTDPGFDATCLAGVVRSVQRTAARGAPACLDACCNFGVESSKRAQGASAYERDMA